MFYFIKRLYFKRTNFILAPKVHCYRTGISGKLMFILRAPQTLKCLNTPELASAVML